MLGEISGPSSLIETEASNRYTIRPMAVDDLEQVEEIDQQSFSLPWPAHSFRYELLENDVSRQWVVEMQSINGAPKIIGMIVVWLIMDEAHIATIAVHPAYRGAASGGRYSSRRLAGMCRTRALSPLRKCEPIAIAIDMYRKLGFEVVGLRKRYYQDTNEDAILMTLRLRG
jgi:ribosomal-protein-alanine N-acetyltransferase